MPKAIELLVLALSQAITGFMQRNASLALSEWIKIWQIYLSWLHLSWTETLIDKFLIPLTIYLRVLEISSRFQPLEYQYQSFSLVHVFKILQNTRGRNRWQKHTNHYKKASHVVLSVSNEFNSRYLLLKSADIIWSLGRFPCQEHVSAAAEAEGSARILCGEKQYGRFSVGLLNIFMNFH